MRPQLYTGQREIDELRQTVAALVRELNAAKFYDKSYFKEGLDIEAGVELSLPHKLGGTPRGFIICDRAYVSTVAPIERVEWSKTAIVLKCASAVEISLLVFR